MENSTMINTELQNEVETLAKALGQTPDDFLNELLVKKREAAKELSAIRNVVSSAEASGFQEVDSDTWACDLKSEARRQHAPKSE